MQAMSSKRCLLSIALALQLAGQGFAGAQSPAPQQVAAPAKPTVADIRKAKAAYDRGLTSEAVFDWPAAFDAYKEASALTPTNATYLFRRELLRFLLVQEHTDHAERYATAGNLAEARKELEAALALDPSYAVARERLEQFQDPPSRAPEKSPPELAATPVEVQPRPGTRDFDFRGDTKTSYQEVARQFGVMATFDPELGIRPVRFRVSGVDFATAMRLLGDETHTFWLALDAHTIFVAQDTPAKRQSFEPQVTQRISLAGESSQDQMNETMRLVRELLGITHTELNLAAKTLTVRDTQKNVALAASMVHELEQAPGELMLEVEVLAVDRNLSRSLGITPPSSGKIFSISPNVVTQLRQAQTPQQLLALIQSIFGSSAGGSGLGAMIPPLLAFGGGASTFFYTLSGARANFSDTVNLIRRGRRMLLLAQDGRPTSFFIGERFPVSLALLSASLNPVGFTPTISSAQFPILSAGSFPRTDFATGKGPAAVIVGVFNGVLQQDLVTANQTDNTVSILLGLGNGSFQQRTDINVGKAPVALAGADFNGDSKLDLAVVNKADNTVSILTGKGDGTFSTATTFPTGTTPVGIVTGDFNGDGFVDMVVVNQADNTFSLFLGDGDGGFKARLNTATGAGPVAVATGDFNDDGKLDLVVANQQANTISVYLGTGNGAFTGPTNLVVPGGPTAVTVADVNGDGHPDLIVTNGGANSVTVFLGKGDGTFPSQVTLATGNSPSAVVAANFGIKGFVDLIVANQKDNTISLFPGNGDGTFGARLDLPVGAGPAALAAADFTGSGILDLAVANQTANTVSVILNAAVTSSLATSPQSAYPASEYEDIGLKMSATPHIHPGNEVTLQLSFEIRDLAGSTINGIPVIANRTVEQTVRLKEDESTVLSGIMDREETKSITGAPGLANIPGVSYFFSRHDTTKTDTELIIVITPRRVRLAPRVDRNIYTGRDRAAGAGVP
jgi:type II secretory pathway component GspD/PulD (secretin)